jgi:hypothetical protein
MRMRSPETRYARYCAWCTLLRIEPASFERWQRMVSSLPERIRLD